VGRAGVRHRGNRQRQHDPHQSHKKQDQQYAVYFHCQTTLVDTFRGLFPKTFKFEGNRCIVFDESERVPAAELKICIGMALTYHHKRVRDWNATS